jgi:hypothetical protein
MYVRCILHVFLMLKHWFSWKYQYNKYMVTFIDIYIFILASGCVSMDLRALFCLGPIMLLRRSILLITIPRHQSSPPFFSFLCFVDLCLSPFIVLSVLWFTDSDSLHFHNNYSYQLQSIRFWRIQDCLNSIIGPRQNSARRSILTQPLARIKM